MSDRLTHDDCWELWEELKRDEQYRYEFESEISFGEIKALEHVDYAWMQHEVDCGLYGHRFLSNNPYAHPELNRESGYRAMEKELQRIANYDYHESGQRDIDAHFLKYDKSLEDEQLGDIDFTPWGKKEALPKWKVLSDRITELLS